MDKGKATRTLYNALQWTWGLPQTLAGACVFLKHRKEPHFNYKGACATAWDKSSGVSLGKFIFVPRDKTADDETKVSSFLLDHEYGHSIQSLILGPLYLLLVGAPSLAWNRLPYFDRKRRNTGKSYYSAVFERTASNFGEKVSDRKRGK